MAIGFLEANSGRHYFEIEGHGSAVVLIPGFTLDTRMWDNQFEAFAARHRVLRYDLRGAGKSAAPDKPYTYEDDLRALMDHLDIADAHIVGLSLGGAIAIDFALVDPGRVRSLIPVGASAIGGFPWHPNIDQWFVGIGAAARRGDIDAAKALWMATDWFTPALRNATVAAKLRQIVADYSGWHLANKNPVRRLERPANDRLQDIDVPTLVVTGALDLPYYNLPIAERLVQTIPRARSVVIENAGHMSNMEDPESFNRHVLDFLAGIDTELRK